MRKTTRDAYWEHMGQGIFSNRAGKIYRHKYLKNQWKWKKNVILAPTLRQAEKIFSRHATACPDDLYWDKFGSKNFTASVGRYRGALYKHRVEPSLWLFKERAFEADSVEEAIKILKSVFEEAETQMRKYAILLNGEVSFYLEARGQFSAVTQALTDERYKKALRERPGETVTVTAEEVTE